MPNTDRDPLLNDVEQALLWQVQKQPPLYWWPEPKASSTRGSKHAPSRSGGNERRTRGRELWRVINHRRRDCCVDRIPHSINCPDRARQFPEIHAIDNINESLVEMTAPVGSYT
ncbi:hypothetical protein QUA13_30380 [Microcoleus sp. S28C3]|uniref:hypothetical protein n=1 Tax=Microcoleus sp. S28C3 TaxID=3055414 RepID=UPI002FD0EDE2